MKKMHPQDKTGRLWKGSFPSLQVLIFLLGIGLYLNTLPHGFVFDDVPLIEQNSLVTELRWAEILTSSYRPMRTLSYAVNFWLGGLDPFGYHLFNVLLHSLNGLLLFWVVKIWTRSVSVASLASLIFLVHPVQTAAVAYISGRKDLLATAFLLTGLILFSRARARGSGVSLPGIFLLFFLAILSKEIALVFPLVLVIADLFLQRNERNSLQPSFFVSVALVLRRSRRMYLALGGLASLGLSYALFALSATQAQEFWGGSWLSNLGTSFRLFSHYLRMALWPSPLIADYSGNVIPLADGLLDWQTLLCISVFGGFCGLAVLLFRRFPLASVGLLWFLVGLTPVLQFIPFHELAADHFLYLPLAGLAMFLADMVASIPVGRGQWLALLAVGGLSVLAMMQTVKRNRDWRDSSTLWEATYRSAPGSFRANLNLGWLAYRNKGDDPLSRAKALELTRRALELKPLDEGANNNIAAIFLDEAETHLKGGRLDAAEDFVRQAFVRLTVALDQAPEDGSVLGNAGNAFRRLGLISERRGEPEKAMRQRLEAQRYFEAALRRDQRRSTRANWYNYALLYMDVGKLKLEDPAFKWNALYFEAIRALTRYLSIFPQQGRGYLQRAVCHWELGHLEDALLDLDSASRFAKSDAEYEEAQRQASQIQIQRRSARPSPD